MNYRKLYNIRYAHIRYKIFIYYSYFIYNSNDISPLSLNINQQKELKKPNKQKTIWHSLVKILPNFYYYYSLNVCNKKDEYSKMNISSKQIKHSKKNKIYFFYYLFVFAKIFIIILTQNKFNDKI